MENAVLFSQNWSLSPAEDRVKRITRRFPLAQDYGGKRIIGTVDLVKVASQILVFV